MQGVRLRGVGEGGFFMPRDRALNYREKHMALGLCIECPRSAREGRLFCAECSTRKVRQKWERSHPGQTYVPFAERPRKIREKRLRPDPVNVFWSRVSKDGPVSGLRPDLGECWQWIGARDLRGYGSMSNMQFNHVGPGAHRIAYWLEYRIVPQVIDHLCENHSCVRPSHLDNVTLRENLSRAQVVRRSEVARAAGGQVPIMSS